MIIFFNLYSYKGRTSLFAYFIFVLFVLVLKKPLIKHKKIIPVLVFFTIVGGYIFPFLYINTPQSIIDFIARSTGKPFFSGREVIWSRFFLALKDIRNFIIGPGSWRKEEFTTLWADNHVYSMHNNYLDNMLCYGVIGALFIISFTVYRLFIWAKNNKIDNYICVCGYLCFLILGYTENTYNYAFFAVLSNVVLGMALYEDNLCLPQTYLSSNKISCK